NKLLKAKNKVLITSLNLKKKKKRKRNKVLFKELRA
ncbi:hypothetical protein CLAFUW4_00612, partial [Fulvia fulva]